jgi:V/A-type H+-transporting ATPase subunit I
MPVVKMQKVRIIGLKEEREKLVEQLQKLESIHLKDFEEETLDTHFSNLLVGEEENKLVEEISHIESTLTYIDQFREDKTIIANLFPEKVEIEEERFEKTISHFNNSEIVKRINSIKEKIAKVEEQISALRSEVSFLLPWENLSWLPADFKETQTTKSLFAKGPKERYSELNEKFKEIGGTSTEIISSETDSLYMLFVYWKENDDEILQTLKDGGFEVINLSSYQKVPSEVINSNQKKIESLYKEKEDLFEKVKRNLKYREKLMIAYDGYLSQLKRERAKEKFRESERVFVLQGWIREGDRKKIEKFFQDEFPATCIENISPDEGETPPIEVKNPPVVRPFQSVTSLFGLPHYGEVDPAGLVAPFFFLFFGLCLTDAGYGIVLMALTFLAMRKIIVGKSGKQFFYLFLLGGFSAIFWGIITGGWFGIEVDRLPQILKRPIIFNPLEDLMKFFILALSFGVIQVLWGMGIEMYEQLRERNFATAFANQLSYIIILPGALLWMISREVSISQQSNRAGLFIMLIGGGIMVFASLLKKGRNPLLGLIVSLGGVVWKAKDFLGNILSYSRLMALGLATSVIALVVNTIAGIAWKIPFFGILAALLILVGGHIFNIAINTLGGFVHTTRLQFVEFFSYFFQGGGEAFEPLAPEGKYVITKKGGK